jgi:hypothetical protein
MWMRMGMRMAQRTHLMYRVHSFDSKEEWKEKSRARCCESTWFSLFVDWVWRRRQSVGVWQVTLSGACSAGGWRGEGSRWRAAESIEGRGGVHAWSGPQESKCWQRRSGVAAPDVDVWNAVRAPAR